MARHDDRKNKGRESESTQEGQTSGVTEQSGSSDPLAGSMPGGAGGNAGDATGSPAAGVSGATGPETQSAGVNTETGEIHAGAGELEAIELPKKIVAKDIVGRAALKCTKEWKSEIGADNKPVLNGDGSPKGEWIVTPPTPLYTVFGSASGTEQGQTSYGDWTGFTGTFEAVRTADGKRFRSNRLILQEPAQTLLVNALSKAKKEDSSASISFAFNVGKRTSQRWVDTNEGNTYEYTVESIINVEKSDPLAAMRQHLRPMLPKPALKQLSSESK